jgi:hypothetical protein
MAVAIDEAREQRFPLQSDNGKRKGAVNGDDLLNRSVIVNNKAHVGNKASVLIEKIRMVQSRHLVFVRAAQGSLPHSFRSSYAGVMINRSRIHLDWWMLTE